MALSIPTSQELFDQKLADLEAALGQTAPIHDQALLRVLAASLAAQDASFYHIYAEAVKQNLVLTAYGDDLDRLGLEYGVIRKAAVQAVMEAEIETTVDIPALTIFSSDSTKKLYFTTALASPSGGTATIELKSQLAGADYTLAEEDTLTIQSPIGGASNNAEVTEILTEGIDRETDAAYKRRIQTEMRTVGGGGNNADYRTWAEAVEGVERAYPYSGCSDNHNRLIDGDMEATDTSDWLEHNSPTLSKETTDPAEGTRYLRITRGATAYPSAYQTVLNRYSDYRVTGYARGDGTCVPDIRFGNTTVWTGTSSTSWQAFDFTAECEENTTWCRLVCGGGSSSNYVEFDGVQVLESSGLGDVTVIVECTTDLDADGIPDQDLLGDVYDAILTDPTTGIHRPPCGILNAQIHVEPIYRTVVDLEIRGLSVATELETQCKAAISSTVTAYLLNIIPFIDGLDSPYANNNTLTDLVLSQAVQDVLTIYSASAEGIGIDVGQTGAFISSYVVGMGETLKLGTITYV